MSFSFHWFFNEETTVRVMLKLKKDCYEKPTFMFFAFHWFFNEETTVRTMLKLKNVFYEKPTFMFLAFIGLVFQ